MWFLPPSPPTTRVDILVYASVTIKTFSHFQWIFFLPIIGVLFHFDDIKKIDPGNKRPKAKIKHSLSWFYFLNFTLGILCITSLCKLVVCMVYGHTVHWPPSPPTSMTDRFRKSLFCKWLSIDKKLPLRVISKQVEQSLDNRCLLANCLRVCLWNAILFKFSPILRNSTSVWQTDGQTHLLLEMREEFALGALSHVMIGGRPRTRQLSDKCSFIQATARTKDFQFHHLGIHTCF